MEDLSSKTLHHQSTIKECIFRTKIWEIDDPLSMKISLAVGKMIATDIQLISIVDDFGFRQLLNVIEPIYKLPSRQFITESVLEKLNNDVRSNIEVQLMNAKSIPFATDIWTSRYKPDSDMSMTSHWIDDEFKQCSAVLFCEKFDGSHSSDNIKAAFDNMVSTCEILPNAYHIIVHDDASYVKRLLNNQTLGSVFALLIQFSFVLKMISKTTNCSSRYWHYSENSRPF
jgi:hypothetical protein